MIVAGANKESIVSFVVDNWKDLVRSRLTKERIWVDCIRAYMCDFDNTWRDASKESKRSARYFAATYDAVESLHSQLSAMIMPNEQWMFVEPGTYGRMESDDKAAEEATALLRHQQHEAKFTGFASTAIKQATIVGNVPFTVGWRIEKAVNYPAYQAALEQWEEKNRSMWESYQQESQSYQRQAKEAQDLGMQPPPPPPGFYPPELPPVSKNVAYAGPSVECGDIFNYVVDPFSPDPKRALRIRKFYASRETILAMSQPDKDGYSVYSNTENITEQDRIADPDNNYLDLRYKAFGLLVPQQNSGVLCHEASGTMEIPNGDGDNRSVFVSYIATIANERTLIRWEPTFLWSGDLATQLARYNIVPGQVYGIGAIEPFLGLQELINVRVNQTVDVGAMLINPEYKMVYDGVTDPDAKSAPGRRHMVGDVNNLVPMDKDFRGIQISMADVDNLTREFRQMTRSLSAAQGPRSESATKTALDANVAGAELNKIASTIEEELIEVALDLFLQMDVQFIDEKVVAKSLQEGKVDITEISPESIRYGWSVRAKGSKHFADKNEQIQGLMMFGQTMFSNQFLLPAINPLEFAKKLYGLMGFHDADKIFNDSAKAQNILDQMLRGGLMGGNFGNDPGMAEGASAGQATSGDVSGRSGPGADAPSSSN